MQFAERLSALMKQKGVTNYRLSKDIGCSPTTVGYWLKGKNIPTTETIQSLSGYFGVSTDYMMGSDDTDTEENAEMAEMLEDIRRNPELRTMFSITRNATPKERTRQSGSTAPTAGKSTCRKMASARLSPAQNRAAQASGKQMPRRTHGWNKGCRRGKRRCPMLTRSFWIGRKK